MGAAPPRPGSSDKPPRTNRYAPVAGAFVLSWATTAYPASIGFRWCLVRTRQLRGGAADGLASGSRSGATSFDEPADEYYPHRSEWAWHEHRVEVPDGLPGDVIALWLAPDCPEDLGRQASSRLVARSYELSLADSHLASNADAACLHDAAMLALPCHDSAPLDAFGAGGRRG